MSADLVPRLERGEITEEEMINMVLNRLTAVDRLRDRRQREEEANPEMIVRTDEIVGVLLKAVDKSAPAYDRCFRRTCLFSTSPTITEPFRIFHLN